jgi:hypothetical protein
VTITSHAHAYARTFQTGGEMEMKLGRLSGTSGTNVGYRWIRHAFWSFTYLDLVLIRPDPRGSAVAQEALVSIDASCSCRVL